MAKVNRSNIWKGRQIMNVVPLSQMPARVKRQAPVRVKLERISCDVAKSLPPEGDPQVWFDRLMTACGTASPDFIHATLFQLQGAARLPAGGLSETAVNAALAMIENEQPRGETECALVIQMAAVHAATMAVLGRLGGGHGGDRHVLAAATAVSRLSRTFAILVEALRRLRTGGSQVIRVERVDVREGGQAVIGHNGT